PQRQGDEGAEDEEIVEREAPDADLGERRQLLGQRHGFGLAQSALRVGASQEDEARAGGRQHAGIHQRGALPAQGQKQERATKLVRPAPTLPAPKMPRAVPWRSGSNQAEV